MSPPRLAGSNPASRGAGSPRVAASRLSADQAALLRCPRCGNGIEPGSATRLDCTSPDCGASHPIVDGCPILLLPSSVFAPNDRAPCYEKRSTSRARDFVFRFTPDLELRLKQGAQALEREVRRLSPARIRVLNVGGKHAASAVRPLREHPAVEILELDFALGPSAQLVADPERLPLADGEFDVVVIDSALEHVPDAAAASREIARVLRDDGLVFADTPFLIPVHGGAFDFARFSHRAHRRLFSQFVEIESGISSGPALALCWSIQQFLLSFTRSQRGRYAVKLACRLGLFWLKYADHLLAHREAAYDGAFAFYFLGRKSEKALDAASLREGYRGTTPNLLSAAGR